MAIIMNGAKQGSAVPNSIILALGVPATVSNRYMGIPKELLDMYKYIHVVSSRPTEYSNFNGSVNVETSCKMTIDGTSGTSQTLTTSDVEISTLNVTKCLVISNTGGESTVFVELHN